MTHSIIEHFRKTGYVKINLYFKLEDNMTRIELLKEIWNHLYDPATEIVETIEKYFHPDYEQCINGHILNRTEYIRHVAAQRETMDIDSIDYKETLEKENELFTIYYPQGKNKSQLPIEAEVIAYVRFENQQIIKLHGQVRLMKGDASDVDMKNS
jgi:uncharacterized protein YeeX (DUF496 family)